MQNKFDVGDRNLYDLSLETVQEKVNDKSSMTLDVSELMSSKGRDRGLAHLGMAFSTKKIINGEVIQQK